MFTSQLQVFQQITFSTTPVLTILLQIRSLQFYMSAAATTWNTHSIYLMPSIFCEEIMIYLDSPGGNTRRKDVVNHGIDILSRVGSFGLEQRSSEHIKENFSDSQRYRTRSRRSEENLIQTAMDIYCGGEKSRKCTNFTMYTVKINILH